FYVFYGRFYVFAYEWVLWACFTGFICVLCVFYECLKPRFRSVLYVFSMFYSVCFLYIFVSSFFCFYIGLYIPLFYRYILFVLFFWFFGLFISLFFIYI